jgi:hypothetical protein
MRSTQLLQILVLLVVLSLPNPQCAATSDQAQVDANSERIRKSRLRVTGKVTVNAPLHSVWLSIHEARTEDPDLSNCQVLVDHECSSIIKETMVIPLLGEANCTLSFTDLPPYRMDYKLIESNKFTTFDGSWILLSSRDGLSTVVWLSCSSSLRQHVPSFLMKAITARKIDNRLNFVKSLAEKREVHASTTVAETN